MNKKILRLPSAIALLLAVLAVPAVADDYPADVTFKLGRGLANASLGWVELFKNAYNEPAQNGPLYIPVGFVAGILHTLGRTGVGVVDIASFLVPSDSFIDPEYIWEDFHHETSYGFPSRRHVY